MRIAAARQIRTTSAAVPAAISLPKLVSILCSPLAWLCREIRLRLAERHLKSLDDRMLEDLGITRSQARQAARGEAVREAWSPQRHRPFVRRPR